MKKSNNQANRQRKLRAKQAKRDKQDKHLLENSPPKPTKFSSRIEKQRYNEHIERIRKSNPDRFNLILSEREKKRRELDNRSLGRGFDLEVDALTDRIVLNGIRNGNIFRDEVFNDPWAGMTGFMNPLDVAMAVGLIAPLIVADESHKMKSDPELLDHIKTLDLEYTDYKEVKDEPGT